MITAAEAYERAVTLTSPETQELISRTEVLVEQAYGKELTATSIYFDNESTESISNAMSVFRLRGFQVNLRTKPGYSDQFDYAVISWVPR